MRFETRIDVDAAPDTVWSVVRDITGWPDFIATVDSATLLDDRPLGVGTKARLKQPGMPALVWRVTEWDDGKSFTWEATSAGVTTTATHVVAARDDGGTTLTLGLVQTGFLAPLIGLLTGGRTRRYVTTEAASLKARSETGGGADGPADPAS